ncbi:hypothetical protein LUZ63_012548 [Rhynchospora breviuscula]|uniref:VQ domain-containing protein n=1 Tax=Rhynchospora breviuscula TaxID=2022672 RepID=A0A9Q0HS29_9POAL|nr:hypothetical protein LUZ63_012548 [Rhynchospora breviuscula]
MDAKQPPRRELQGPRPTPLKVRKDSHKIKKPPVAPAQPQPAAAPIQHRPPVIIYAVSPKVIHTNPSEFMSLVQRLTGSSSCSATGASSSAPPLAAPAPFQATSTAATFPFNSYLPQGFLTGTGGNGGLSPAARLAAIEQGRKETRIKTVMNNSREEDLMLSQFGIDTGPRLDRVGLSPAGILSPVPSSLPVISPNLFSPLNKNDQTAGGLGFLHELSPVFSANRSLMANNLFATTPGSFFANTPTNNYFSITTPPVVPSPGAYWDIFHQYQDL